MTFFEYDHQCQGCQDLYDVSEVAITMIGNLCQDCGGIVAKEIAAGPEA